MVEVTCPKTRTWARLVSRRNENAPADFIVRGNGK